MLQQPQQSPSDMVSQAFSMLRAGRKRAVLGTLGGPQVGRSKPPPACAALWDRTSPSALVAGRPQAFGHQGPAQRASNTRF